MVKAALRGLVGILVTDRDAHLLKQVLLELDRSVKRVLESTSNPISCIDLLVSLRTCDIKSREICKQWKPSGIRSVRFSYASYIHEWSDEHHTDPILEAISSQRNLLMKCAKLGDYQWIFFLDSDILINSSTLFNLLQVNEPVVSIPYKPRWAHNVCVGVKEPSQDSSLSPLQFLINPQQYKGDTRTISVAVIGMGCALLNKEVYDVEFRVRVSAGGVKGEDIGFCWALDKELGITPKLLLGHSVTHVAGGTSPSIFLPQLPSSTMLITTIKAGQVKFIEEQHKLIWKVLDSGEQESSRESNCVLVRECVFSELNCT